MRHDIISDVLYVISNAERVGKRTCTVPASKLVKSVLMIIQKYGYIGNFEFESDRKAGKFSVELVGRINKAQSIRPRFAVEKNEYEKWELRFLPAKSFGFLVVSTSQGLMTQKEAQEKKVGGRLLAYIY